MPILGSFGAGSARGLGLTSGGVAVYEFQYLVVAGGGGGGAAGGGGAGGFRTSEDSSTLELEAQEFTITVGNGSGPVPGNCSCPRGGNSVFSTITSTGGGGGGYYNPEAPGGSGSVQYPAQTGNTPPVSPPQGNPAGPQIQSGGGGAGGSGGTSTPGGGAGGVGRDSSVSGSSVEYAGGGGGGGYIPNPAGGPAQDGGGPGANRSGSGSNGTNGKGGGGGGMGVCGSPPNGAGGSGVVVVRAPSAATFTVSPGTNTTSTAPNGDKVATFTVSGTLTVV